MDCVKNKHNTIRYWKMTSQDFAWHAQKSLVVGLYKESEKHQNINNEMVDVANLSIALCHAFIWNKGAYLYLYFFGDLC